MSCRKPIAIVGPTGVGKSAVALAIAETIGGEILSVDSMQVYRGMDIGTGKASRAERDRVPHHLIDIVAVDEPFDAARFSRLASEALLDIQQRQKTPVACGGTGLYLRAWIEGLGSVPPPDPELRSELERTPLERLLAELEQEDPLLFERIDRHNPRRIIRAVEIVRLTGRPCSSQRATWSIPARASMHPRFTILGLRRDPDDLRQRIDRRVDAMFEAGLVEETRALVRQGLARNRTAACAIGYRQVLGHIEGRVDLPSTIQLVKLRTRQYARRQMTWFRHQLEVCWLDVRHDEPAGSVVDRMLLGGYVNIG